MRLRSSLWLALVIGAAVFAGGEATADALCGNGDPGDPGETCDDGNTTSGDGCGPDCLLEECADGVLTPDGEECDDGNTVNGDGCASDCTLECGNGTVEGEEECDGGGESPTCDDDCTSIECGDSNVNEAAGEDCDDGNTIDTDECPNACVIVFPVPPSPYVARCINTVNKRFAGVARAHGRDAEACFRDVAAGRSSVAACFGTDARESVAQAEAKTVAAFASRYCEGVNLPLFAFTTPAVVNDAAEIEMLAAFSAVFGDPPALVTRAADAPGAQCQAEAAKQLGALANRYVLEANRAKKAALRGGKGGVPPPADGPTALGASLDVALAGNAKLAEAEARSAAALAKRCPLDPPIDALFECGGAATTGALAACIVTAAKQAACEALELADAIPLDCPTLAP